MLQTMLFSVFAPIFAGTTGEAEVGYRLGPHDALRVEVVGEADMSRDVTVPASCRIDMGMIGLIEVCGQTPEEIARSMEVALEDGYLRDAEVMVDIVTYGSQRVEVKGAVKTPGLQVLRGPTPLSEVVTKAGGPESESVVDVMILRESGTSEFYPIAQIDQGHVRVRSGDTVILQYPRFVYVHGEVNAEGPVPYREGLTVTQALGLAGGMTTYAASRRARVVRADGEKVVVNLRRITQGAAPDIAMSPDDKLVVAKSLF